MSTAKVLVLRIYFCSDVHASRRCWKKFIKASGFYEADVIIMGGDLTGKFVVPIIEGTRGVHRAQYLGVERKLRSEDELRQFEQRVADAGQYAYRTTPDEQAWFAEDQTRVDALFARLAVERVAQWLDEAEMELAGKGVRVFASAGNDDVFDIDALLAASPVVEDPNGTVIDLGDGWNIMGMGWGNQTPWDCPRDTSEEDLSRRIAEVADTLADPHRTIFNFHVPPLGSGLDLAPRLDADLRPIIDGSGSQLIPVGSVATRDAIVKYQPVLGLHGHIHESKGITELAGVPIANPGSEYGEGVLNGLIIELDRQKGITNIRHVAG